MGNETKALFRRIFKKHDFVEQGEQYLSNKDLFHHLWHIVYSLPEEKEIVNALSNKNISIFLKRSLSTFQKFPNLKVSMHRYQQKL
ncbi:MAG: hypothetical protein WDO71_15005 [Bacteroidota bacterium]